MHGQSGAGEQPPILTEVRERVRGDGMLDGTAPVVVMLSGGRDSVCLLDLSVTLRGAAAVRALHVNYGLRPEAQQEEEHCRALCGELGVELEVVRADKPKDAGNTQAWARAVRYDAARELARRLQTQTGPDTELVRVASAHTATDQAETILYRLAASPGRRALLGMVASEGRLIRPLLALSRDQTGAYCTARGLRWREDPSNDNEDYARVRVRSKLLPALREVHPAAEANVLRTAALLREEAQLLDGLVTAELAGEQSIATERLAELHPALARLLVIHLAEQAAGTFVAQAGWRVGEILELEARRGRGELHIGGLVSAVLEHGRLRMVAIAPHYPGPDED
ncbi:MAG TPA: tRNA lysidine(34) synthetase TilS [Solirubrobacteraceae bacterium]